MSKIDHNYYEQVIIYKMLTDDGYLSTIVDHVKPEFFNIESVSSIVTIIKDFYESRGKCPTLTEIKSYLRDDASRDKFREVVERVKEVADKDMDVQELYDNTEIFLREKAVFTTILSVAQECSNETESVDTSELLTRFEDACGINLTTDIGYDLLNRIDDHVKELAEKDKTISVDWPWLDEKLDGGLLEDGRALYVFAGETNIGKSIILGNVALNIAKQGKTVLLVSLEMSEKMYCKRLSSSMTQIPINDLATNPEELRLQLKQYRNDNKPARVLVKEFPPNTITANNLKGFIKKIRSTGIQLDCIVLDYVNLLHSNTGNNSYERIKHATEKLRALSYEFSCPIVTATQLNRSGYNEVNPSLDTVSESIGLAATADAIFSLWQEEDDGELGVIRMGVMKNRFGPNFGSTAMRINYSTLTVKDDPTLADSLMLDDEVQDVVDLLS